LKKFMAIVFANSSFTESVTLETTPAVNVEIDATVEKIGDGMFELEALIVLATLRSVLGPYTDDEGIAMNVALPASFQKKLTELGPVNPISIGTTFPKEPFKSIAVEFAEASCPDMVMETDACAVAKKYDPVEVIARYPDHGLVVITNGLPDANPEATDALTLY
jgi:hypothetical protein